MLIGNHLKTNAKKANNSVDYKGLGNTALETNEVFSGGSGILLQGWEADYFYNFGGWVSKNVSYITSSTQCIKVKINVKNALIKINI